MAQVPSTTDYFPSRPPQPSIQEQTNALEACLTIQRRALTQGKRPFSAVLLGPDNATILLSHQSVDHVNHAESGLARLASSHFTQAYLWTCTLITT